MNPEDQKVEENNVSPEVKSAVSSELSSYMNPHLSTDIPTASQSTPIGSINTNAPFIEQQGIKSKPMIRTFKSDVEETIQSQHLSSINIALAENKKMMERIQNAEFEQKTAKKNYTILIISTIFIVGGILAFAVPYFLVNRQNTAPVVQVKSTMIITPDLDEKINVDGLNLDRIASTLSERVEQSSIRLGGIKNLYLTEGQAVNEKTIDTTKFLYLIKSHTPPEILRTLKPEYMFGMHNFNGNQRFLILKVGSYENSFSGMLAWETNLWSDFKTLFALPTIIQSGQIKGIEIATFQDAIYSNKDSRVVKNSSGNIMFLYSIIDKDTIVITTNTKTLNEIISRSLKAQTVTQ
ncbi:MAG: hypothetical protein WC631_03385 [Candidatus Paceibacterota bacterium]|jgi:hypothetical protein